MSTSSSKRDLSVASGNNVSPASAWKHELNERLQATRARRTRRVPEQVPLPTLEEFEKNPSRASRLAAKVAERYAKAPSYSEILAAEAAVAAEAAAEAAATAARQACVAAQALLAGLDSQAAEQYAASSMDHQGGYLQEIALASRASADRETGCNGTVPVAPAHDAYPVVDPMEQALVAPAQPLPVNLIEFPRELVAARKARPRLEEGPLRETNDEVGHNQLRIFEVESTDISKAVKLEGAVPEWSSIRLDAKPPFPPASEEPSSDLELPLKAAPIEDRLMAGIVDGALVLLAFVVFVLVFVSCTAHPPTGKPALLAAGAVLGGLFVLYQYLFFRFTDGTPGMRYAKIALCTFDDENPTRKAMRRRIPFLLLSAVPLGLGFGWAWFDADRLGWHDRITRMYQRSYR